MFVGEGSATILLPAVPFIIWVIWFTKKIFALCTLLSEVIGCWDCFIS